MPVHQLDVSEYKVIGSRNALRALELVTHGFLDILSLDPKKGETYLEAYEDLFKTSWKSFKKELKEYGFNSFDDLKGFVFGELFLNDWLIEHGPRYDIFFDRIAEKSEDFKGIDAFCSRYSGKDQETLGINHKMFSKFSVVKKEHAAGLGWAPKEYTPIVITTAHDVSIPLKEALQERGGGAIVRNQLENTTNAPKHWKNFVGRLKASLKDWERREKLALALAQEKSSRTLDDWQKQDLEILCQRDRGVYIAPPGSGKTTLEAKLSEFWMKNNPGPVIIITRVKDLASQVLVEMVELNSLLPDRIAAWSDADHSMDLKEPLAVGVVTGKNKKVEETVKESFQQKKNVIIGAVTNHGSVNLLKFCLKEKIHVRIIIDELAEAIPGKQGSDLPEEDAKTNTLSVIYELHRAGLLDKLFGFDAIFKTASYHGMNDASLWGANTPVIHHKQCEMTYEKNVLAPVDLMVFEIDESDIEEAKTYVGDDRKRQIEIASNIKICQYELGLAKKEEQSAVRGLFFSSGSDATRNNRDALNQEFSNQLDLNEAILSGTSLEHRIGIRKRMSNPATRFGVVSNYSILAKGIDLPYLTFAALGYGRLPNSEMLTHIIGRVTRRVPSERGIPASNLKIKKRGRFYVSYVKGESDGGGDYQTVSKLFCALYSAGVTVEVKLVRKSTTRHRKNDIDLIFTPDNGLFEIEKNDIERIAIRKAIESELANQEHLEKRAEISQWEEEVRIGGIDVLLKAMRKS